MFLTYLSLTTVIPRFNRVVWTVVIQLLGFVLIIIALNLIVKLFIITAHPYFLTNNNLGLVNNSPTPPTVPRVAVLLMTWRLKSNESPTM